MSVGDDLLPIGKVVGAHGLRGEVKVQLYHAESLLLESCSQIRLLKGDGPAQVLQVLGSRPASRAWILCLQEVTDRSTAEQLRGSEIAVPRGSLPELPEGEVYAHQLEGLAVVDLQGRDLGRVSGVFDNGGHDVLIVSQGERELLVPFAEEVVQEVDLAGGRIILDPPEGLLEP
jgi:16S rRNA processing protein RimM